MKERTVKAMHIYEKDPGKFEDDLNSALARLLAEGAVVAEVQYAIDPSTEANRRGGFGALVLYESDRDG